MATLCWMTDIHLDAADDRARERFFAQIEAAGADAVLITGDIADGANTGDCLLQVADRLRRPVHFVLGNHDFYGGSIRDGRQRIAELAHTHDRLVYLPAVGLVELSADWGLVGQDGWPDGRLGDIEHSTVFLPDFVTIDDLAVVRHDRRAMGRLFAELGDRAVRSAAETLAAALETYPNVVLATHVPPFREAAWHEGGPCDDQWLPYFSSKAMGEMLVSLMQAHPHRRLLVLCGHTHGGGEVRVRGNLHVITGEAESGKPAIQRVLEFGGPAVPAAGISW